MKRVRKNALKVLVLLLTMVFVSNGLCFGFGQAYADTTLISASAPYVSALASSETEIASADALVTWLNSSSRSTNVKLVGGSGTVFDLSGKTYTTVNSFSGTFNGGYVTIKGINKPLFKNVTNATIKNVYIGSGSVSITNSNYAGAVAQYAKNTTFSNCLNMASVSITSSSYSELFAGGIVGLIDGGKIELCSNHANVTVNNTKDTKTNKYKTSAYAGGIVGFAKGTVSVTNCYVSSLTSSAISITADSKSYRDDKKQETDVKKGKTHYYNGLTRLVDKFTGDLDKANNDLFSKKNELSALNRNINSLKSQINDLENQINAKTKEANDSWCGWKWSYMWGVIAGLRAAQGALWVSIGALEASAAVVRAAISALQTIVRTASNVITYSMNDVNWLEFTKNATKKVTYQDAHAYGIGYMNGSSAKVSNSYTRLVNTDGGMYETLYTYKLKFWSKSGILKTGAFNNFSSNEFTKTITFKAENYYGPISNDNNTKTYYYTKQEEYKDNRYIYIDGDKTEDFNNVYKVDTTLVNVYVDLELQRLFLRNQGTETIQMLVDNGFAVIDLAISLYADIGTKVLERTFDDVVLDKELEGTYTTTKTVLDGSDWGSNNSSINGGYPYLKCRYWQEV